VPTIIEHGQQPLLRRKRVTWPHVACLVLLLGFVPLGQSALAQPSSTPSTGTASPSAKERALALAAEQAFASLDYTTAYRSGMQALAINPRNITVRRLTAVSALQLKRYGDCLRLISIMATKDLSSDDVHTLGECAQGLGSFSQPLRRTLEQLRSSSDKGDAANYWLGVAAYRAENYAEAKPFLEAVVVLPARFESQKRFMLERIADVEAAKTPAKPPATDGSDRPDRNDGKRPVAPSPRAVAPKVSEPPRRLAPRLLENGWFGEVSGSTSVGAVAGSIDRVSLRHDSQKAFDADVEAAARETRSVSLGTVSARTGALFGARADLHATALAGYRSGDFVGKRGSEYGVGLGLSASYSPLESSFYTVQNTTMHPAVTAAIAGTGAALRASTHIESRPHSAFGSRIDGYFDRQFNSYGDQFGQLGGRGRVWIQGTHLTLAGEGFWNLLMGPDLVIGGHWNGVGIDLSAQDLGLFSLSAPPGHSLVSYQRSVSIPKSRTKGVFQIMDLDGAYVEANVAPSIQFTQALRSFLWYRFVSGSQRSYRSSVSKAIQVRQDDFEAKASDSQYESNLHDLSVNLDYQGWSWGGLQTGISASYYATRYKLVDLPNNPSSPNVTPFAYAPLLDRGRQNVTLFYIAIQAVF
jgi:hypothetical protein